MKRSNKRTYRNKRSRRRSYKKRNNRSRRRSTRRRSTRRRIYKRRNNRSRSRYKRRSYKRRKRVMKGGLSDKTKKYAAATVAGLAGAATVAAGGSNMRAIPKAAAVLGTSAVGALATKKAIDLDKKIKDKKKTMARIRSNLRAPGSDSQPVIGVFDMVVSKMHHLVDEEHVNFDTFFNNTVQGQGHQMFPFNIFAFIARKSPDQMKKILNKANSLRAALKYGVNEGLTATHLSTKGSYSEWCQGLKEELDQGELTEEQKNEQIDIQILKGLSTMSDELSGWAFHYLSHFNDLGVAIPAFLQKEMDELKQYFSDADYGHAQIHEIDIFLHNMDSDVDEELNMKVKELKAKLQGCEDKYQLIFCFIFVIMIKDFPTYTGDGYDMKDARNNMVFRSIKTVMRALQSDVQSSKEFIFVHVVKDLFKPGKDGKQLIDEVDDDHPLKETLKAIHEKELPQLQKLQQLQQLYETKKETCHSLISEYLTLKETKMGEDIVDIMTDTVNAFEQVAKEMDLLTKLDEDDKL